MTKESQLTPEFTVNSQYIKDLSFECPNAPAFLSSGLQPEIQVNMDVKVDNYQENVYEVSLLINVEAKANGEKAFIIELDYAGLFTVIRPEEELEKILLIVCPNILFPFARRIIANASQDGSLPPLMLHPIDFVSLYESRKLEQSES